MSFNGITIQCDIHINLNHPHFIYVTVEFYQEFSSPVPGWSFQIIITFLNDFSCHIQILSSLIFQCQHPLHIAGDIQTPTHTLTNVHSQIRNQELKSPRYVENSTFSYSIRKMRYQTTAHSYVALYHKTPRRSYITLVKLLPISSPDTSRDNNISPVSNSSLPTQDARQVVKPSNFFAPKIHTKASIVFCKTFEYFSPEHYLCVEEYNTFTYRAIPVYNADGWFENSRIISVWWQKQNKIKIMFTSPRYS